MSKLKMAVNKIIPYLRRFTYKVRKARSIEYLFNVLLRNQFILVLKNIYNRTRNKLEAQLRNIYYEQKDKLLLKQTKKLINLLIHYNETLQKGKHALVYYLFRNKIRYMFKYRFYKWKEISIKETDILSNKLTFDILRNFIKGSIKGEITPRKELEIKIKKEDIVKLLYYIIYKYLFKFE